MLPALLTQGAVEGMAAEAEVVAAVAILAAVHTSAVADISAAHALAERISVAPASAEPISVAPASAGGLRYRGLPRGSVSAVTVRLRSTAVRTGPPAAGRH